MSMKLGEILVSEGAISRKQLDEALTSQAIFGGRLGTNLVEMGFLDEQKLVECLSRQLATPYVTAEQLKSVTREVIGLISVDLAREYKIVPVSLDKKKLTVAIWDPSDLSALDAISFITGFIIKPLVCSELSLLAAMEKYYGIKRQVRYIQMKGGTGSRSRDKAPSPAPPAESTAIEESPFKELMAELPPSPPPSHPPPDVPPLEPLSWGDLSSIGLLAADNGSLLGQRPDGAPPPETGPTSAPPVSPAAGAAPSPSASAPAFPGTAETAPPATLLAALAAAANRDAIADALVGHLGREFARVALFMIKGRVATGWRCVLNGAPITGFELFQVPLDEPTLLKPVVDAKNFYLGPVLDTPGNTRIVAGLGGDTPDSVLLIPILMMERVVAVFYVDGGETLLGKKLFELQKIIGKAALAFEILILKNKIMLA